MGNYSMARYFRKMPVVGNPMQAADSENEAAIREIEKKIHGSIARVLADGRPDESLNDAGQMTAMQRILALIDPGTWCPLNSLFNPMDNRNGSTSIVKGLAKVEGRWVMIIASDNKKIAGAWVPGQAENLVRASDTAKRLNIPVVYLINCSGIKLDEQDKDLFANRRGGGVPFYRNSELEQMGIPVIIGIYGTNPAGGGYHCISSTILLAHREANMAVGGAGILGGMSPKGYVDMESARQLIEAQASREAKLPPPGTVDIHYGKTGFFREVYDDEYGVLLGIREYVSCLPAYKLKFFRVDDPKKPLLPREDLYTLIPVNQKRPYNIYDIIGRLTDGSEFMEYKKGYGPELVTGIAKVNGLLIGLVANVQGVFLNYPEYKDSPAAIGGKLYRQGLVKVNEFVMLCGRDCLPIVWLQDTTGIDVGNEAEEAELLGLGQSLIYSINKADVPMLEITLRKASGASHYILGGPQGNNTNAFSLGIATTEYYTMNSETAATAMYSRRLVKEDRAGHDLQPVIDKMNTLIKDWHEKSRPEYCARRGWVDEVVDLPEMRCYIQAFTEASYQNPREICPFHQMLLPRSLYDFDTCKTRG